MAAQFLGRMAERRKSGDFHFALASRHCKLHKYGQAQENINTAIRLYWLNKAPSVWAYALKGKIKAMQIFGMPAQIAQRDMKYWAAATEEYRLARDLFNNEECTQAEYDLALQHIQKAISLYHRIPLPAFGSSILQHRIRGEKEREADLALPLQDRASFRKQQPINESFI
ncbi:MAG: hypothetical protein WC861_03895 [Candidatus Micrarchaeia archaeon]|jgi:tetratricopeptide (TPR) repeat protein